MHRYNVVPPRLFGGAGRSSCNTSVHPGGSQCTVSLKTNHNGTLRIQEVTEVSAKLCKSAWEAVRQQSSISFNVRCFHGSKIRNNIVDAASMPSLF